jgi:DUF2892 family protein
MTRNMGSLDRLVRVVVIAPVLVIVALFAAGPSSVLGLAALALAAVMLITSAIGFCPLYVVFGISTRRVARSPAMN